MSESCNCLQHADATRCIVGHFRLEFLQLAKPIGAPLLLRRDSRDGRQRRRELGLEVERFGRREEDERAAHHFGA